MLFSQGARVDEGLEVKTLARSVPIAESPCNRDIKVNKLECRFSTGKDSTPVSY